MVRVASERVLVFQHFDIEAPYVIGDALEARGLMLDCRLMGRDDLPPSLDGYVGVVSMGRPGAAYDDHRFPTRSEELRLLAEAVAAGVPVLGVCLGAQMLAEALPGGRAVPGDAGSEIGWAPVRFLPAAADDRLFAGLPDELVVLHWHGDTVVLPPDAVLLASTDRYPNQAFRVGECAWGVQFHVEVTEAAVKAFVERFRGEPTIADEAAARLAALEPARTRILERFADVVAG